MDIMTLRIGNAFDTSCPTSIIRQNFSPHSVSPFQFWLSGFISRSSCCQRCCSGTSKFDLLTRPAASGFVMTEKGRHEEVRRTSMKPHGISDDLAKGRIQTCKHHARRYLPRHLFSHLLIFSLSGSPFAHWKAHGHYPCELHRVRTIMNMRAVHK